MDVDKLVGPSNIIEVAGDRYYIDEDPEGTIILPMHNGSNMTYGIWCRNPQSKPYEDLIHTFNRFAGLSAIVEQGRGLKITFITPKDAINCFKALRDDKYFNARLISKLVPIEVNELLKNYKRFQTYEQFDPTEIDQRESQIVFTKKSVLRKSVNTVKNEPNQVLQPNYVYMKYVKRCFPWVIPNILNILSDRLTAGTFNFKGIKELIPDPVIPNDIERPQLIHYQDLYLHQISEVLELTGVMVCGFVTYAKQLDCESLIKSLLPEGIELIEYYNFNSPNPVDKPCCLVFVHSTILGKTLVNKIHNMTVSYKKLSAILLRDLNFQIFL